MSVCPSARNNSASTGRIFMKFDICLFFRKPVERIPGSLESDNNNGYITLHYINTSEYLWQHLAEFFLKWEMFETKVVESIKIHK